ncbi:MAG: ribosome small subunit-dependent GTPase A [Clostridia bacterium]|nr:ribosome small subunit-dependent GTPase A [Clostridia bacterium]
MPKGLILSGIGGLYSVRSASATYACRARGLFRNSGITPLPGDHVDFTITDEKQKEGYLQSIHDRKNLLVRPAVANVSLAFVVISITDPQPDLYLADKLLCIFESKGIESVICINKSDLADEEEIYSLASQYEKAGYTIAFTNARSGEGIDGLRKFFKDKVCVFAGQSGVGKSTILNKFIGSQVMETGSLSARAGRGKHTTRHAQFVESDGGFIVDTPGFSSLDAGLLEPEDLKNLYREFVGLSDECRFNGCRHINEPDCAVRKAASEGRISGYRLERYVKIYSQAKEAEIKTRGY